MWMSAYRGLALLALCLVGVLTPPVHAQTPKLQISITFFNREEPPLEPLSLVEPALKDEGLKGVDLGIADDQTTGRFLGHSYSSKIRSVPGEGDIVQAFKEALDAGERLFVADLRTPDLLAIAPLADAAGALVFNARETDDSLRTDRCFKSVFHTAPSRAMKADALAQYLIWKRWPRWFLVTGSHPDDQAYAGAIKRAAKKFGAKIVEERTYEDTGGARRTDTGFVQVQQQIPVFTQNVSSYDILIVADESEVFGDYMPYRTWDARPVAGTSGLVPTAWSRVNEQWGGTQIQRRFEKLAGRPMTERDYNAWTAVRAIGEAVTRTGSDKPQAIHDYLLGDRFDLAAFKGAPLSFRHWDQQMREPMLLATPRMLVSVSPQDQFLHQRSPLDTLGDDEPESRCRLNP